MRSFGNIVFFVAIAVALANLLLVMVDSQPVPSVREENKELMLLAFEWIRFIVNATSERSLLEQFCIESVWLQSSGQLVACGAGSLSTRDDYGVLGQILFIYLSIWIRIMIIGSSSMLNTEPSLAMAVAPWPLLTAVWIAARSMDMPSALRSV